MTFKRPNGEYAVWAMLAIVAVAYMLVPGRLPFMGDDLAYARSAAEYHGGSVLYYPAWVARHWVHVNGRLPNFLAPVVLCWLPAWGRSIFCGLCMAGMLWLMIRLAGLRMRQVAACMALIAAVVLTLQWWDRFMIYMVALNYVFATVVVLSFCRLFLGDSNRIPQLILYSFSFVAGLAHEAATLPLIAGIAVWLMVSGTARRSFDRRRRIMLMLFAIGAGLCVCNPGLLSRLGVAHDDTPLRIVLRSCYYLPVMLLVALACLAVKRRMALVIIRSRWLVFAVAAAVSVPIVAVGGIVGRSGFFCQIYSLIAIAMMLQNLLPNSASHVRSILYKAVAVTLFVMVSAHLGALVVWQRAVAAEAAEVLELYRRSEDGIVYYDYTRYDRMPAYLLGKTTGVPDDDDVYFIETLTDAYGDSLKILTILPTDMLKGRPQSVLFEDTVGDGCGKHPILENIGLGRRIVRQPGQPEMVAVPYLQDGHRHYYLARRVKHPENAVY